MLGRSDWSARAGTLTMSQCEFFGARGTRNESLISHAWLRGLLPGSPRYRPRQSLPVAVYQAPSSSPPPNPWLFTKPPALSALSAEREQFCRIRTLSPRSTRSQRATVVKGRSENPFEIQRIWSRGGALNKKAPRFVGPDSSSEPPSINHALTKNASSGTRLSRAIEF